MAVTKMTPQLRFPEFTDEWFPKKFDSIFEFSTGKNIKQNEAAPNLKIPCVRYGELYHLYNEVIVDVINKTDLPVSELHFSDGSEIILPSAGEDPLDIGSASALTRKGVAIGRTINILKPKNINEYNQIFASYYINKVLKKRISQLAKGNSISNVYNSDLKKLSMRLPDLAEQEKIADFLTAVDERIRLGEQKLAKLEQYKRGVMQQIFSQKIRFKDENGNEYPEWEEKKLGEVATIKTGKKDANIAKSNGRYRFYTCSRDYLRTDIYSFEGEAILVAGNADVGLCHYYDGKFEAYQRTYVLQNFEIDGKFLYKYLSHFFRQYALGLMQTSAMTYITLGTLQDFTVPLPSGVEQQKISTFLAALDDKITAEKSKLTAAKQFKKALLQRMFV